MQSYQNTTEIRGLLKKCTYSIDEVSGWLVVNSDLYEIVNNKFKCSCSEPLCNCYRKVKLTKENELFYNIYCELEELIELHTNEQYAAEELNKYSKIKHDKQKVKAWILGNKRFACWDLFSFLIKYFEESENNIIVAYYDFRIFINRECFKNIIDLKLLFDQLYYVERVCPEKEEQIDAKLKLLKETKYYYYVPTMPDT